MFKVAHIVPTAYLEPLKDELGDFHLILAHRVLEDKKYTKWYQERQKEGHDLILDNSFFEQKNLSRQELNTAALEFGSLFQVTRELDDPLENLIESFEHGMELYNENQRVLFPLRASSYEQFMIFTRGIKSYVTTRGVITQRFGLAIPRQPFLIELNDMDTRILLIKDLDELFKNILIRFHLFGLRDGIELQSPIYREVSKHRLLTCDSSSAFIHGSKGIRYTSNGLPCEKIKEPIDFDMFFDEKILDDVIYNIRILNSFVKGNS